MNPDLFDFKAHAFSLTAHHLPAGRTQGFKLHICANAAPPHPSLTSFYKFPLEAWESFRKAQPSPEEAQLGMNIIYKHRADLIPQFHIGLPLLGSTNAGEERTNDDSKEFHAALPDALWLSLAGIVTIWWTDRHQLV